MFQKYSPVTLQEKIVHTMLGTLVVLATLYVVVLLSLVFSVIERKENMVAVRDLSSEFSVLEGEYASIVSSISNEDLTKTHFSRIDDTTFTVRKDAIASYTVLYAH
ncbi:MAG: hypothetical protein RLZZ308_713 [Candidatus Parcubacteria bacterium]|jgi:hypothetical protein